MYRKEKGFTLIELMIVVAIIGVLAAVAYPSYNSYVLESGRADAHTAILRIQLAQENWRVSHSSYSNDKDELSTPEYSDESFYKLEIDSSVSATDYKVTAKAQTGTSQANDTGCTSIVLTVTASGEARTPAVCW